MEKPTYTLSDKEFDAILTALRLIESHGVPAQLMDIYTNAGKHDGLPLSEIDALCEAINFTGITLHTD